MDQDKIDKLEWPKPAVLTAGDFQKMFGVEIKTENLIPRPLKEDIIFCATKEFQDPKEPHEPCQCKVNAQGIKCEQQTCLNRTLHLECPTSCGNECRNQVFKKKSFKTHFRLIHCEGRGFGLATTRAIDKGEFVLEFVGEVLLADKNVFKSLYACDFKCGVTKEGKVLTIEPTTKGGIGRYTNSSHAPNTEMLTFLACDGSLRNVLVALQRIEEWEEILWNYGESYWDGNKILCVCRAPVCPNFKSTPLTSSPKITPGKKNSVQSVSDQALSQVKKTTGYKIQPKIMERTNSSDNTPPLPSQKMTKSIKRKRSGDDSNWSPPATKKQTHDYPSDSPQRRMNLRQRPGEGGTVLNVNEPPQSSHVAVPDADDGADPHFQDEVEESIFAIVPELKETGNSHSSSSNEDLDEDQVAVPSGRKTIPTASRAASSSAGANVPMITDKKTVDDDDEDSSSSSDEDLDSNAVVTGAAETPPELHDPSFPKALDLTMYGARAIEDGVPNSSSTSSAPAETDDVPDSEDNNIAPHPTLSVTLISFAMTKVADTYMEQPVFVPILPPVPLSPTQSEITNSASVPSNLTLSGHTQVNEKPSSSSNRDIEESGLVVVPELDGMPLPSTQSSMTLLDLNQGGVSEVEDTAPLLPSPLPESSDTVRNDANMCETRQAVSLSPNYEEKQVTPPNSPENDEATIESGTGYDLPEDLAKDAHMAFRGSVEAPNLSANDEEHQGAEDRNHSPLIDEQESTRQAPIPSSSVEDPEMPSKVLIPSGPTKKPESNALNSINFAEIMVPSNDSSSSSVGAPETLVVPPISSAPSQEPESISVNSINFAAIEIPFNAELSSSMGAAGAASTRRKTRSGKEYSTGPSKGKQMLGRSKKVPSPGPSTEKRKAGRPPVDPSTWYCAEHNTQFTKKFNYDRHVAHVHGIGNKFKCKEKGCKCSFVQKSDLKRHADTHKPRDERDLVICPFCGKDFTRGATFNAHLKGCKDPDKDESNAESSNDDTDTSEN